MTPAEKQFLQRNQLPTTYLESANRWFTPLLTELTLARHAQTKPLIIGINGSQGSGKSTLADYLCTMLGEQNGLTTVSLSLDDFYLTRAERQVLASEIHPLFKTRGVPGTHDIPLAFSTIASLNAGLGETLIPRFDKSTDDRCAPNDCDTVTGSVDIIIFEGWCVGSMPQTEEALQEAANTLEKTQDAEGVWRTYVNNALASEYQTLFETIDQLIMLQAPSFDWIYQWRLEQEQKMIARLAIQPNQNHAGIMSEAEIAEFIAHYQRLTEYTLQEMPSRADHLFSLNSVRNIIDYSKASLPH